MQSEAPWPNKGAFLKALVQCRKTFSPSAWGSGGRDLQITGKPVESVPGASGKLAINLPAPFRGRRRRVRRGCAREFPLSVPPKEASVSLRSERRAGDAASRCRELSYPVPPDKAFDSLRSERRAVGAATRRRELSYSVPAKRALYFHHTLRRAVPADAIRCRLSPPC